jgi:hypothetical protein
VQSEIQSFVIRVWHEAVDREGNATAWRGSIDHVGSDRRIHFQELAKILDFIQEEAGIHSGEHPPERMA